MPQQNDLFGPRPEHDRNTKKMGPAFIYYWDIMSTSQCALISASVLVSKISQPLKKAIERFNQPKTTFAHPISWLNHKSQKQYQQRHSERVLSPALFSNAGFLRRATSEQTLPAKNKQFSFGCAQGCSKLRWAREFAFGVIHSALMEDT